MLRVVVAVALATALMGVAMPVVADARVDHADARVATELDRLATTAERLRARNDPAPPGRPGPRRSVTLHLPGPSWASASLEWLTIPPTTDRPGPGGRVTVSWEIEGGDHRTRRLRVPVVGPAGGLTLRGGGSREVTAELTHSDGRVVVRVRRRGFKLDAGASGYHDDVRTGARRPAPG